MGRYFPKAAILKPSLKFNSMCAFWVNLQEMATKTSVSWINGAKMAAYEELGTSASTQYFVGPILAPEMTIGINIVVPTSPSHSTK